MVLKPQDILVALKLATLTGSHWSFPSLSASLGISVGEAHKSIQRLTSAHLYNPRTRTSVHAALEEFLLHGLRYAFPVDRQGVTFGIPTAWAAPPLKEKLVITEDMPPVWAHPDGNVKGEGWVPLYPTVAQAALNDDGLYQLLALLDSIRGGNARERELAGELLHLKLQEVFNRKKIPGSSEFMAV